MLYECGNVFACVKFLYCVLVYIFNKPVVCELKICIKFRLTIFFSVRVKFVLDIYCCIGMFVRVRVVNFWNMMLTWLYYNA